MASSSGGGGGMAIGLNSELMQQVDSLIDDEDKTVVLAMKLAKNQASWTVAGRRGRVQSKPRIIAITAKRSKETQKYKVKIHMIKPGGPTGLELLKSYRLQALTSIELVSSDTTGRSFLLVFDDKKDNTQPQWTTRTVDDRNQLIVCLLRMFQENLKTLPKVIGIDVVEMALWAKTHKAALPIGGAGGLGEDKAEADGEAGRSAQGMMMQDSLVSKVEEEGMEALLGTYVMGIDEAEAFSERLKRELGALEAANVHAILESEALVGQVLESLDDAWDRVEDMDNWLNVFNVKLRHMRGEIETIEEQNNMLEVQAVNNKALLEELDRLLDNLTVPPEMASVLSSGSLEEAYLPQVLEGCAWLMDAIAQMQPPALNPAYNNMRAVREKRMELEKLKLTITRRSTEFIEHLVSDTVQMYLQRGSGKSAPDHRELRRRWQPYSRLVRHLKALDYPSVKVLRATYIQSFNLLIRREVREYATELRASARAPTKGAERAPFLEHMGAGGGGSAAAGHTATNAESQGVSDAFAKLLKVFLPLFADEAAFFKAFMCFGPAEEGAAPSEPAETAELSQATDELFDGVQDDFRSMVEWGYKADPLRCISMAGQTEAWQQQQQQMQPGTPGADVTRKLLLDLQTRIREFFFRYVQEANAAIEKYDRGVKQAGVLSFVPRFAAMAVRMEGLVTNGCRDLVDQAYNKLLGTMFAILDKVAQLDPRQESVLLLENHAVFQNSMYDLAGPIPTLRLYYNKSSDVYEKACAKFIDSIIMGQFDKLFEYKQKIKSLLNTIGTEEIPFQIGFGKTDLRKVLKAQLSGVDRSLQAMHVRMKKSLNSGELLATLWHKCQETFMEQYRDLEALIAQCYANEVLTPSSNEMSELFGSVSLQHQ